MVGSEHVAEKENPVTDQIKSRADGSIDTAHYMRIGRMVRSQAAHDMTRTVLSKRTSRTGTTRPWILPVAMVSIAAITLPYLV